MVLCSVLGCKNRSDNASTNRKNYISFHLFPKEQERLQVWIKASNQPDSWLPTTRSVICSQHFDENCVFYRANKRFLHKTAVPTLKLCQNVDITPSSGDNVDLDTKVPVSYVASASSILDMCRVCLASNYNMPSMTEQELETAYEQLTGIDFKKYIYLPDRLCVECSRKLKDFQKFREESLRSHSIMLNDCKKYNYIQLKRNEQNEIEQEIREVIEVNDVIVKEEMCDLLEEKEELSMKEESDDEVILCSPDPISMQPAEMPNTRTQNFKTEFDVETVNENYTKLNSLEVKEESPTNTLEDLQFSSEEDEGEGEVFEEENEEDLIEKEEKKTKNNIQKAKAETKTETNNTPTKRGRKRKEITVRKGTKFTFLNNVNVLNMFDISKLSLEEQRADVEKRRETSNYKKALFRCTECYKGFLDENAFNAHMTRHSNVDGDFNCNACKIHFKNRNAAKRHETANHGYRFSCKQCPLVTTHRHTATMHMKWHGGSSYTCPHCPEVFTVFSTYLGHIRIKHPSGFACDLCGYSFLSLNGVFLHKKYKHRNDDRTVPEDGPFCEPCNIRFLNDDVYNKHLRVSRKHTLNPDPNEPNRRKTGRTVEGYRDPKPCEQCGMQLANAQAYHSHFRRMHPEKNRTNHRTMTVPYKYRMIMCEQCGKMFNSTELLKDHMWVHTGEKRYKCDKCGKSFTQKTNLEFHMKAHSNTRPSFECPVCGKHFAFFANRRRHMFIHKGLKPFKCEICGKCFTTAGEQRSHVDHVHLKKPWPKRSRLRTAKRRGNGD